MPSRRKHLLIVALMPLFLHWFAAVPAGAQDTHRIEFRLTGGERASGPNVIRLVRGDRAELSWQSDLDAEIHLHGYDIRVTVEAGGKAMMSVEAHVAGRFPISLHETAGGSAYPHHRTVTYLEVHPD